MDEVQSNDHLPLRLRLEGEMTIYRAEELKQTLLAAMENPADQSAALEVDLSAVTQMDAAGIQLLMMAREYARTGGRELRLVARSPAVVEVIDLLKLGTYFGDSPVIRSNGGNAS